jgi:molecular chaperone GrpE
VNEKNSEQPDAGLSADTNVSPEAKALVSSEADASEDKQRDDMNSELQKAQAERDGYLEDLKRLKAEFENYRKRILREQTEVVGRASVGVVASLLSVLDNFDLAVSAAEETRDFDKMLRGVEMVYGELKEVLKSEGLEPIDAKGRHFDPSLHEAAVETPGDEEGDLIVTEVLRPGYMFKGRVLRPAMVRVSRKAKAP